MISPIIASQQYNNDIEYTHSFDRANGEHGDFALIKPDENESGHLEIALADKILQYSCLEAKFLKEFLNSPEVSKFLDI